MGLLGLLKKLGGQGVAVINSAVFNGGFLIGGEFFDYRKLTPEADPEMFAWRDAFRALCDEFGNTPAQNLTCAPLKWGDRAQMARLRGQHAGKDGFDIVVAADVIYFEGAHKALIETLITMGSSRTVYYLAFQKRLHNFEGAFFSELLPKAGFAFEEVWSGDGGGGWDNLGIVRMVYRPRGAQTTTRSGAATTAKPQTMPQTTPTTRRKQKPKKPRNRSQTRKDDLHTIIRVVAKDSESAIHANVAYA